MACDQPSMSSSHWINEKPKGKEREKHLANHPWQVKGIVNVFLL